MPLLTAINNLDVIGNAEMLVVSTSGTTREGPGISPAASEMSWNPDEQIRGQCRPAGPGQTPQWNARMRNRQLRVLDYPVIIEQDVDIQTSGPLAARGVRPMAFSMSKQVKEVVSAPNGLQARHLVQEPRLISESTGSVA